MKILLIKSYFRLTSVGVLARQLARDGHEVHVLTPAPCPDAGLLEREGIVLHTAEWPRHRDPWIRRRLAEAALISRIARIVLRNRVQVLHLNLVTARLYGRLAGLLVPRLRIVSSIRGLESAHEASTNWIDDATVAVSSTVASYLAESGIPREKIVTIRNGVEPAPYEAVEDASLFLHRELGLPPETRLIGMIAFYRTHGGKGHEVFFEAARIVAAEHENVRFVSIGGDLAGDGRNKRRLEEYARNLGIGDRIFFLGNRDDVPDLTASLDVHVMPSYSEGCPMALLETMARGVPNVASRIDAISEIVEDGVTGLLFEPGDHAALAAGISLLLKDPGKRRSIGSAGAALVNGSYSAKVMGAAYSRLFEKLISNDRLGALRRLGRAMRRLGGLQTVPGGGRP